MVQRGSKFLIRSAFGGLCAFAAGAAVAEPLDFLPVPAGWTTPPPGWIVTIGGQVQVGPEFPGARQFAPGGAPWFSVRRATEAELFQAPDDNFDLTLWGNDRFRFGPSIALNTGRYRTDDRDLDGVHGVPWGFETGLFAEVWPVLDRFRMHAEVRYGFGFKGVVADVGADWVERRGRLTLSLGPRARIGDGNYQKAFFGVTPSDALANGSLTPFAPRAGMSSVGALAGVTYAWNEHWTTSIFLRYDRLVASTAESPIVKVFGSNDQFTTGISLRYSFYTGDK